MKFFCRLGVAAALLCSSMPPAVAGEPRRVLLLHSFGPHFAPWSAVSGRFREELIKRSPDAIDLYEASLETARLAQAPDEVPFVEYLRSLFSGRDLDLVVAMGAPAARFVQRYRTQVFAATPLLITGSDERFISTAALTWNDTAVATKIDLSKLIENIFQVLPDTSNIAFAIGNSALERLWVDELRRASQAFAQRASFEWWNEISLEEMLKRAATRPQHAVIFYAGVRADARGVPHEEDRVFAQLHAAANAPIFGYADLNFGHGIVGGPHVSTQEIGRQAAAVASRILRGEAPASITTPPLRLEAPAYDWRELRRWNISESALPAGSKVHFREPTAWERYRWPLAAVFIALAIQGSMITWLLIERHARRNAEVDARNRLAEVIHLNRSAEAGALSASFAHELSQPLEAIMLSAATAERLLAPGAPESARLRQLLADIREADGHAVDIVQHLRKLVKRSSEVELQEFDLNKVIANAVRILAPESRKRNVALRVNGKQQAFTVRADPIHLQQVILNLASNGMDAMTNAPASDRTITIQTASIGAACVEVSVSDSGPGIPEHKLAEIFDTFYTTKAHGTGLGLSIARTIVETYGGKIWAENRDQGGAVFRFTLPLLC
ncbi:MAG TPA: ATP-binding protein [Hyphomicrobiaceae bacterium]|nr:ATP-binding protein [Hyphomicrobiaceae bacterium]